MFSTCIPCSAMTPPLLLGLTSLPLQIQLFRRPLKTKRERNLWSTAGSGSSTPEVSSVFGFGLRPQSGILENPKECFSSNKNVNLQLERSTPWHPLCRLRWERNFCVWRDKSFCETIAIITKLFHYWLEARSEGRPRTCSVTCLWAGTGSACV